jgi:hypothetical protein
MSGKTLLRSSSGRLRRQLRYGVLRRLRKWSRFRALPPIARRVCPSPDALNAPTVPFVLPRRCGQRAGRANAAAGQQRVNRVA